MKFSKMTNLPKQNKRVIEFWARRNNTTPDGVLEFLDKVYSGIGTSKRLDLSIPADFYQHR